MNFSIIFNCLDKRKNSEQNTKFKIIFPLAAGEARSPFELFSILWGVKTVELLIVIKSSPKASFVQNIRKFESSLAG
jgi:hypothetical protein